MNRYIQSRVPLGKDGLLPRTGLAIGQSAPHVLIPGDPHRSQIISTFFRDAEFTAHRGTCATYTGHSNNGTPVGVTSSGMGASCIYAALEELADAGAKSVIRVGTCSAIQTETAPGTLVIGSGCVRGEGASYELVPPEFPAVADPYVVSALMQAAQELGENYIVGLYRSHDAFYMESRAAHPGLQERMQKWVDAGVLVVENESGTLYPSAHLLGLRAGCICVALGTMFRPEMISSDLLPKRIEAASRVAIRAAEILEEVTK